MAFKKYSREEVRKTTKLELILILFSVDYLKEVLITHILKHPMELL